MECSTIHKLSYRPTEVRPRWIPPWAIRQYSAPCAAMEGNTIYRASYLAPGEECDDGGTDPNACCQGEILKIESYLVSGNYLYHYGNTINKARSALTR